MAVSLTPLIDVVFILLVFFMLATNFNQWRSLSLSVPGEGGAAATEETALRLEVLSNGGLRLQGDVLGLADLERRVAGLLGDDPGRAVRIVPEPAVPLERIVAVMDRLSLAGARNISLDED
ncbi:ExbD/TolR family protein [Alkalilimnicola sp. S0819]|uniref:ExbD/TolR family protein n=1 Tax=Alkalilimnicola sp. S0819 TaxID=2613922 RepID=UPI0021F80FF5|nr:biopolymer transporter ExbD [Alkalilimnicola sp. S0819]